VLRLLFHAFEEEGEEGLGEEECAAARDFEASSEFLFCQFEEGFAVEGATGVENGCL
jgi:hypothetical protein